MLSMARLWSKLRISGTLAMIACLVLLSLDAALAAGETPVPPPPPPIAPGAKPSKDRFSKATKRLREQRRSKAQREKAKARAKRAASKKAAAEERKRDMKSSKPGGKVDLSLKPEALPRKPEAARKEKEKDKPVAPKIRRPAPPLPTAKYTELEQQLQRNLSLHVTDLGPDERWQVVLANRGPSTVEIVADPRLLSFEAHVPGKTKPVSCKLPDALQPKPQHIRRHALS